MTDEWPPVKVSQNDFASLEEIIEQYKEGDCERNSVIAALTTGIASICVVREIRCPDASLILPYLERLDAFDRDQRLNAGPVFSRKAHTILTRMEEDRQRRNNRRKMRRQKYDDVSGDEEENLSSYLLSMTSLCLISAVNTFSSGSGGTSGDFVLTRKFLQYFRMGGASLAVS
ncbi:hypothetical protein B0H14DRAFT_3776605 [Mycena olivaceomarginata]|nr:hypothetical protein B0H14DRAFT_3776605 [Mycena olivaceomarginata]